MCGVACRFAASVSPFLLPIAVQRHTPACTCDEGCACKIDPKDASADANLGIAWCNFFKRQVPEAKAYADKAAAAGRSVTQLKENID